MTTPYKISCHCGHIQLEVAAELSDVFDCNLLDLLANRVPALVRAARSGAACHGEAAAVDLCLALGDGRTAFLPDLRRRGHPDIHAISAAGLRQRAMHRGDRPRDPDDPPIRREESNSLKADTLRSSAETSPRTGVHTNGETVLYGSAALTLIPAGAAKAQDARAIRCRH